MPPEPADPQSSLSVLLVEDDADHRMIAEHHLRRLGDRIATTAHCGTLAEATRALEDGGVDVVLLDLTLPDSELESTVDAIASLAAHGAPVIAMSSLDTPDLRARVLERGAAAFLGKARMDSGTLGALLDELDVDVQPKSAPAADAAMPRTDSAESTTLERAGSAATIASKLAHDANSWIANATFRLACLRPVHAEDKANTSHLDSIDASLRALTSLAEGARGLIVDAASPVEPVELDLAHELPTALEAWRRGRRDVTWTENLRALPTALADRAALTTVVGLLAENAAVHGGGRITTLRFEGSPLADSNSVRVTVTDDGGPWTVEGETPLTDLASRGTKRSPSAGAGLFRARVLMERMGGGLELARREDGSHEVRLVFLRR